MAAEDFWDDLDPVNSDIEEVVEEYTEGEEKNRVYVKRLTPLRIVMAVFVGIIVSCLLAVGVYGLYLEYVRYPQPMEIIEEHTGMYCLSNWVMTLQEGEGLEDGYISKENVYANDDEDVKSFIKKVLSSIDYEPYEVVGTNKYGNPLKDSETDRDVYVISTVSEGEGVAFSYVDYTAINPEVDVEVIKGLMEEAELKRGDVDYNNKLVDVFCKYISGLEELPLVRVEDYVPNIVENSDGTFSVLMDEDIYIDDLLFNSEDLHDLETRFSVVAGGELNKDWVKWSEVVDNPKEEPEKYIWVQPRKDWVDWSEDENYDPTKEPLKYNTKDIMAKDWCGTYELTSSNITANIGEGTKEDPAGLNTGVLTSVYVDDKAYPIKVKMIEYGASEDAINWFEGKNVQNRGIDVNSEVQYCYYVFEITNMSSKTLTIEDNSTLSDFNANISPRTGLMYGLQDVVTLKPDETGIIESWSKSTELPKKYVIWGKDFARRSEPVYFRVLAGNIDDPSENKGVSVNNTREEE